jgi:hypothetical protein
VAKLTQSVGGVSQFTPHRVFRPVKTGRFREVFRTRVTRSISTPLAFVHLCGSAISTRNTYAEPCGGIASCGERNPSRSNTSCAHRVYFQCQSTATFCEGTAELTLFYLVVWSYQLPLWPSSCVVQSVGRDGTGREQLLTVWS